MIKNKKISMNKFSIEVISKNPKKINGLLSSAGRITIGDFTETFIMSLDSWTIEDYRQQWKEAIERIKTHDASCLVTTAQNISTYPFIMLWLLYKVENKIFLQNQLINTEILEELNLPFKLSEFNIKNCYNLITPREILSEDGETYSEWSVMLDEIE